MPEQVAFFLFGAEALVVFWLLIYFVNRTLEPRYSLAATSACATGAFGVLVVFWIGCVFIGAFSSFMRPVSMGAVFLVLFVYLLICRRGSFYLKLFWVLVCFSFYIISAIAMNALSVALLGLSETPGLTYSSAVFSLLAIILMGNFLRPITRRKMRTTVLAPKIVLILVFVLVISWVVLILFNGFLSYPSEFLRAYACVVTVAALGVGIIVYCTFALFRNLSRQARRDMEQQALLQRAALTKIHFNEVDALYKETRKWRHDYANHLQMLMGYSEMKDYAALSEYLRTLGVEAKKLRFNYNVGDDLLNAILNAKATTAEAKGITLFVVGKVVPLGSAFPLTDMASLISNILDNAIEACERIVEPAAPPAVIINFVQSEQELKIYQKNPTDGNVRIVEGRLVSSKTSPNHGVGSSIIDSIARKYHGYVDRRIADSEFELFVLLRINTRS